MMLDDDTNEDNNETLFPGEAATETDDEAVDDGELFNMEVMLKTRLNVSAEPLVLPHLIKERVMQQGVVNQQHPVSVWVSTVSTVSKVSRVGSTFQERFKRKKELSNISRVSRVSRACFTRVQNNFEICALSGKKMRADAPTVGPISQLFHFKCFKSFKSFKSQWHI